MYKNGDLWLARIAEVNVPRPPSVITNARAPLPPEGVLVGAAGTKTDIDSRWRHSSGAVLAALTAGSARGSDAGGIAATPCAGAAEITSCGHSHSTTAAGSQHCGAAAASSAWPAAPVGAEQETTAYVDRGGDDTYDKGSAVDLPAARPSAPLPSPASRMPGVVDGALGDTTACQ